MDTHEHHRRRASRVAAWVGSACALIAWLALIGMATAKAMESASDVLAVRLVSHVRWQRAHQAEGQLLQQAVAKWQEETAALGKDRAALEADAKCAIDWNASPPTCAPKAEDTK